VDYQQLFGKKCVHHIFYKVQKNDVRGTSFFLSCHACQQAVALIAWSVLTIPHFSYRREESIRSCVLLLVSIVELYGEITKIKPDLQSHKKKAYKREKQMI
jgi:hypothetical protein